MDQTVLHHEIRGEIVDVDAVAGQLVGHEPHLFEVFRAHLVLQHELVDGGAVHVLLEDALFVDVHVEHHGQAHAQFAQPTVVADLGLDLVAELIVRAGLVVDLLEYVLGVWHALGTDKEGIAPLAFAQ